MKSFWRSVSIPHSNCLLSHVYFHKVCPWLKNNKWYCNLWIEFDLPLSLMIQPLTESESTKAIFQYSVLDYRMKTLIAGEAEENKTLSLYYHIVPIEISTRDSDLATYIMLFNTVVSRNECVIES